MRSRKLVVGLIVLALLATFVAVEGARTIHLTQAANLSTIHANPGQLLDVRLDAGWTNVFSTDQSIVTPLARIGDSTTSFIAVFPGKAYLSSDNGLKERCLALVCGWRVEVDVG